MRSVAIAPHTNALNSFNKIEPPSFGFARPPSLKDALFKNRDMTPFADGDGLSSKFFEKNITSTGKKPAMKVYPSNWRVPNSALECVPEYFVLERTSRFVGGTCASVVSARISDCLRSRSIMAEFDNKRAKAKCTNQDFVQFRIRLYAGRGDFKHGVIVEVQRRNGSGISFMQDCRAVLDAAEEYYSGADPGLFEAYQVSELECVKGDRKARQKDFEHALTLAFSLLQSGREDCHLLAIDSLSALTDLSKTDKDDAIVAAKSIISEDNRIAFETMSSFLNERRTDEEIEGGPNISCKARNLVLLVLSNIFHLAESDARLQDSITSRSWFVDQLVPIIVEDLKNANGSPHDAHLAAKSLSTLSVFSAEAKRKAREIGALMALSGASEFGHGNHKALAKESEHCTKALQCH